MHLDITSLCISTHISRQKKIHMSRYADRYSDGYYAYDKLSRPVLHRLIFENASVRRVNARVGVLMMNSLVLSFMCAEDELPPSSLYGLPFPRQLAKQPAVPTYAAFGSALLCSVLIVVCVLFWLCSVLFCSVLLCCGLLWSLVLCCALFLF